MGICWTKRVGHRTQVNFYKTRTGKPKRSRCRYIALVTVDDDIRVVVRANRVWRSHVWAANAACPHALTPGQENKVISDVTEDISSFYVGASFDFEFHHKGR